jgi:hypothetical protein
LDLRRIAAAVKVFCAALCRRFPEVPPAAGKLRTKAAFQESLVCLTRGFGISAQNGSDFAKIARPPRFECFLPGGLAHARNLTLVGKVPKADTADRVIAEIRVRAAADFAAVILARREFRLTLLL